MDDWHLPLLSLFQDLQKRLRSIPIYGNPPCRHMDVGQNGRPRGPQMLV